MTVQSEEAAAASKQVVVRMVICAVGIICSFGMWGYMLEFLTTGGKKMSETGEVTQEAPSCPNFPHMP